MGFVGRMLQLVGLTQPPLSDRQRWEADTRRAAAAVIDDPSLRVSFVVNGGLGEQRRMRVEAELQCSSYRELRAVTERLEAAIAPVLVRLPDAGAQLWIRLSCRCAGASPLVLDYSVSLSTLATRFGLVRWRP